jgi:hypothetical protein
MYIIDIKADPINVISIFALNDILPAKDNSIGNLNI